MKKLLLISLYFFICTLKSQDLQFEQVDYNDAGLYGVYGREEGSYPLMEEHKKFYKEKGVKTVSFYDAKDQLFCFFEFDLQGNIIAKGYRGRNFFSVSREKFIASDTLQEKLYYQGNLIARQDSHLVKIRTYKNEDTLMQFKEIYNSIYKSGSLINGQNKFYLASLEHVNSIKTDYDSLSLFLARRERYKIQFSASVRYKTINLDTNALKSHKFFKLYARGSEFNTFVDGEGVAEEMPFVRFCGTVTPEPETIQTLNDARLFEARYLIIGSEKVLNCSAKYEFYTKP